MDYERVTIGQSFAARSKPPHVDIRILVVDDDATTLAIVSAMLRTMKYQVVTVRNPVDALTTLRMKKDSFDIVVTDLHMPYMNGFELQKQVDEEFKLPVIMMSADDKESVILKGLKGGVAYFIVKPVSLEDLKNVWQYAIASKKGKSVAIDETDRESFHGESSPADQKISAGDINSASTMTLDEDKQVGRKSCKRKAGEKSKDKNSQEDGHHNVAPRKAKVIWTNSLHNQFLLAIRHVTLEKAVPKRILEFMNVPGLTRENVASHLQKYRIFLKRVAEKGAMAAKGSMSMSDKVFRSSFVSGNSSLHMLKNVPKELPYTQFPRQQQMRITSSPILEQGFRDNNTSTTSNSSNLGLLRLPSQLEFSTNALPNHRSLRNLNFVGNQPYIQHPIIDSTITDPVYQPNFPGFRINSNHVNNDATSFGLNNSSINGGNNNGSTINGTAEYQQQSQAWPGLLMNSSSLNHNSSKGNFNANMWFNFGGIQRNMSVNNGGSGFGLPNDHNMNNINTGSSLGNPQAQGGSSARTTSVGFENRIQELLFTNSINHQQNASPQNCQSGILQSNNIGYKDGMVNVAATASHAEQSSGENDLSNLILMADTNLQQPVFHQQRDGGENQVVAPNLCEAQVNPSENQVYIPDLPESQHAQQHIAPHQHSFSQNQGNEQVVNPEFGKNTMYPPEVYNHFSDQYSYQKQGSLEGVDCELKDMYQDWDVFLDSLLNSE